MKIRISNIVRNVGESESFEGVEPLEGLLECAEGYQFSEPVKVKGKLTNTGGHINMKADVSVKYETECARCLDKITGECSVKIDEDFVPASSADAESESGADTYTFDGDWLTVDKAIVDGISLALPFAQLCNQDCMGLCPDCGINLNSQKCSCADNKVNPDMAKLRNFLNNNGQKDRG